MQEGSEISLCLKKKKKVDKVVGIAYLGSWSRERH